MGEGNEAALVRACLDGDQRAFEELLGLYEKPVYNVALRMLRNREDALDVTQAVFLKVFEKLPSYDPKYKLYSWIYRIAINESIDTVRRSAREQQLPGDEPVSQAPGPEAAAGADELSEQVEVALGVLKPEYRAVIVLKYFLDCSYADIGRILELEEKTVKSRLFTARQLIKERLETDGVAGS